LEEETLPHSYHLVPAPILPLVHTISPRILVLFSISALTGKAADKATGGSNGRQTVRLADLILDPQTLISITPASAQSGWFSSTGGVDHGGPWRPTLPRCRTFHQAAIPTCLSPILVVATCPHLYYAPATLLVLLPVTGSHPSCHLPHTLTLVLSSHSCGCPYTAP